MALPLNRPSLQLPRSLGALALALYLLAAGALAVYSQGSSIELDERVIASAERKYGPVARKRLEDWQALMMSNRSKSESEKLKLVNDFFNQIPWISDPEHWSKADGGPRPLLPLGPLVSDREQKRFARKGGSQ